MLDLRKKPVTTPAPAASPIPGAGLPFRMPLPAGKIVNLTPEEQKALDLVGWKEGEPIPDIHAALQDVLKDISAVPDYSDVKAAEIPPIVDISTLPAEKQQELIANVRIAQQQAKQLQEMEASQVHTSEVSDINDQIAAVRAGNEKYQVVLGKPKEEAPEPTSVNANPTSTTGLNIKGPCANCGFNGTEDDVLDITGIDKENFIVMLQTGARFYKTYALYGGSIKITFRSLTQKELDIALTQASCDTRDGKIADSADFFRKEHNYEQAIAIKSIESSQGVVVFPELSEVQYDTDPDKPFQTVLSVYSDYVTDQIKTDSMLRSISTVYMRFKALVARLEANMSNPDFWNGIV